MPGFPTQIVGTPTNRGKARRYKKEAADPSPPFANDATGFGMTAHKPFAAQGEQECLCYKRIGGSEEGFLASLGMTGGGAALRTSA
jgi:hypothetical protein